MAEDNIHQFFMEAHRISQEAQFIVDSLPNAEQPAVECLTHQLSAIRTILATLDDPAIDAAMLSDLVGYVDSLLQPLENFLSHPPPPVMMMKSRLFRRSGYNRAYVDCQAELRNCLESSQAISNSAINPNSLQQPRFLAPRPSLPSVGWVRHPPAAKC
ncbi:hypothetical protein B0H10DRAFT_1961649 [Mycena sp. CBHHK59/15]|nr:hypothetical protein B0H10DRAFT_1961649 [Mycena sp. CBHHK59/15]